MQPLVQFAILASGGQALVLKMVLCHQVTRGGGPHFPGSPHPKVFVLHTNLHEPRAREQSELHNLFSCGTSRGDGTSPASRRGTGWG